MIPSLGVFRDGPWIATECGIAPHEATMTPFDTAMCEVLHTSKKN